MKRFFSIILFLTYGMPSVSAQKFAVGGSLQAWHDTKKNSTILSVVPDIGYTLSEHWYVGAGVGYAYSDYNGQGVHSAMFVPYARYFYLSAGRVRLFVDCTAGFAMDKPHHESASYAWQAGFRPGVILSLTERFSLAASFGFMGYRDTGNEKSALGSDGWGLDLNGNTLQLGFFYSF